MSSSFQAAAAANGKNNQQLRRYATIGLISRKKIRGGASKAADKENGAIDGDSSMLAESKVATRRNLKAQQKAARKEFRHLLNIPTAAASASTQEETDKKCQLGLKTRCTKGDDQLLNIMLQQKTT